MGGAAVWEALPGVSLAQISAGRRGTIWGLDKDGSPCRLAGSTWQPGAAAPEPLASLSVANACTLMAAGKSGKLYSARLRPLGQKSKRPPAKRPR